MPTKKFALFFLLAFLSIMNGGFLGSLDFYGFVNGQHAINLLILVGLLISIYLSTIVIFILDFSDKHDLVKTYATTSFFFGLTFFFINKDLLAAGISMAIYFIFLYYIYATTAKRETLFIKFMPQELFSPVLRCSFFYIILLLVLLSFFQTRFKLAQHDLISPQLVILLSKPTVAILNKQLGGQLQQQLSSQFGPSIDSQKRVQIIHTVLKESVKTMPKEQAEQYFGLKPSEIPIDKTIVYDNGDIDLSPVVTTMSPAIAHHLNNQLQSYSYLVPFIVPLVVFLFLQPFMWPLQFIEVLLTGVIFKLLFSSRFLSIRKETTEVERVSI